MFGENRAYSQELDRELYGLASVLKPEILEQFLPNILGLKVADYQLGPTRNPLPGYYCNLRLIQEFIPDLPWQKNYFNVAKHCITYFYPDRGLVLASLSLQINPQFQRKGLAKYLLANTDSFVSAGFANLRFTQPKVFGSLAPIPVEQIKLIATADPEKSLTDISPATWHAKLSQILLPIGFGYDRDYCSKSLGEDQQILYAFSKVYKLR